MPTGALGGLIAAHAVDTAGSGRREARDAARMFETPPVAHAPTCGLGAAGLGSAKSTGSRRSTRDSLDSRDSGFESKLSSLPNCTALLLSGQYGGERRVPSAGHSMRCSSSQMHCHEASTDSEKANDDACMRRHDDD